MRILFKGIKDSAFAYIMNLLAIMVSVLVCYVYVAEIKMLWKEIGYVLEKLMFILYLVIIIFCVLNATICHIYTLKKTKTRLNIYRLVGATKVHLLIVQLVEFIIKYHIAFAIGTIIGVYGFGMMQSEYFATISNVDILIIYGALFAIYLIVTLIVTTIILFPKKIKVVKE